MSRGVGEMRIGLSSHHWRRSITAGTILALLLLAGALAPSRAAAADPAVDVKVAVIVGPVGALSETYLEIGELAAAAAEEAGATVARAYTPNATPDAVLAAVDGASIVVYLGHGVGVPNPYSAIPDPSKVNGWALQGEVARGDHADSWQEGTLAYYGESWIAANARPAPGWVMIYSNACYAPGASEGHDLAATADVAHARVAGYSRVPLGELGAAAYFATDFYGGAAHLVGTLLGQPDLPFGHVFASEPRYLPDAVARLPHPHVAGREVWLHRSPYFDGKLDYWYAFAGDPRATMSRPGHPWAAQAVDPRWWPLYQAADGHSH
jgi:hypothetical protein